MHVELSYMHVKLSHMLTQGIGISALQYPAHGVPKSCIMKHKPCLLTGQLTMHSTLHVLFRNCANGICFLQQKTSWDCTCLSTVHKMYINRIQSHANKPSHAAQVSASSLGVSPIKAAYGPLKVKRQHMMVGTYGLVTPDDATIMSHAHTFDGR